MHAIAERHSVSMANVVCRYVLDQPAIGGIIIGARLGLSEHRDDNLRIFEFVLDDADKAEIIAAVDRLRPIPGDCGDEYRRPPYLTASGDLSHHLEAMPAPYEAKPGTDGKTRVFSGTVWEDLAGFSRAIRQENRIFISGTTATHSDQVIGGSDPVSQTHFVIDKIDGALQSLGACLDDVIRTRVYIQDMAHWEPISNVHGMRFRNIKPANTLVQAGIIGSEYLVEIEAEASVSG